MAHGSLQRKPSSKDAFENMGAQLVKEVATKTNADKACRRWHYNSNSCSAQSNDANAGTEEILQQVPNRIILVQRESRKKAADTAVQCNKKPSGIPISGKRSDCKAAVFFIKGCSVCQIKFKTWSGWPCHSVNSFPTYRQKSLRIPPQTNR